MPSVAIVNDEEETRKALGRLLRASGLDAESYASGQEFLEVVGRWRPDCVVLDLHMPGMSSLQVLRELRSASRFLSVVVISADDEPDAREQCLDAGACAYLRKPFENRALLNAVSAAMRSRPSFLRPFRDRN